MFQEAMRGVAHRSLQRMSRQFAPQPGEVRGPARALGRIAASGRAGLVGAGLVCVAAVNAPSPAIAAFPLGGYPHVFAYITSHIEVPAEDLVDFDVLNVKWWNTEGDSRVILDELRTLNPEVTIFVYFNALGLSMPEYSDPTHITHRFMAGIKDEWKVRDDAGQIIHFQDWSHMALMNISDQCPIVDGETWGDYVARFVADELLATGIYQGVFWDNHWGTLSWFNDTIPNDMDLNNDGVADTDTEIETWYWAGLEAMNAAFRARAGQAPLVVGNGSALMFEHLNGRYFELFPNPVNGAWNGSITEADAWNALGMGPRAIQFSTRGSVTGYQRVRFGLASALLVGGMLWHEPPSPANNFTMYDELTIDLGQPIGERVEIGIESIAEVDFEGGQTPGLELSCANGIGVLTTDPNLVIDGQYSVVGQPESPPNTWNGFMCTDPSVLSLEPNTTYTIEYDYAIAETPPAGGYFYAGMRSDQDPSTNTGVQDIYGEAGDSGHIRKEITTGNYSDFYLYFGLKNGGRIVMDNFHVIEGRGGVFRRDFDSGIVLVNPTLQGRFVDLGETFYRIDGELDPINNGEAVDAVWMNGEDGLVLMRGVTSGVDPAGGSSAGQGSPPLVRMAFPNPVGPLGAEQLHVNGVPGGGAVRIYNVHGRLVRALSQSGSDGGQLRWDLLTQGQRQAAPGVYVVVVEDAQRQRLDTMKITVRR